MKTATLPYGILSEGLRFKTQFKGPILGEAFLDACSRVSGFSPRAPTDSCTSPPLPPEALNGRVLSLRSLPGGRLEDRSSSFQISHSANNAHCRKVKAVKFLDKRHVLQAVFPREWCLGRMGLTGLRRQEEAVLRCLTRRQASALLLTTDAPSRPHQP